MPRFLRSGTWPAFGQSLANSSANALIETGVASVGSTLHNVWHAAWHTPAFLKDHDSPDGGFAGSENANDWLRKVNRKVERVSEADPDWWADDQLTLFRAEDWNEWMAFTIVFVLLIIFDNWVLHRKHEALSFAKACAYTAFWVGVAGCFNLYVFYQKGQDAAFTWATGYLLEWMLSVDNLFVFHLIFKVYGTPENQMHKPLFYGIVGAIVFRMFFFVLEEALFHSFWWAKVLFGLFLIYTGVQSALADDEEEDPSENPIVVALSNMIPMTKRYDEEGRFFVYEYDDIDNSDPEQVAGEGKQPRLKATLLVAVVLCLEVTDIVFAVDSVSAIVAQVPDLFLAYTACVFAMLGLRAMFFMVNNLIGMFKLLKYGVAIILVFIGVKLLAHSHIHMTTGALLAMLVGVVATSILGSVAMEGIQGEGHGMITKEEHDEHEKRKMTKDLAASTRRKNSVRGAEAMQKQTSEDGTQTTPSLKKAKERGLVPSDTD